MPVFRPKGRSRDQGVLLFDRPSVASRCRVCGHRTVPVIRRSFGILVALATGAVLFASLDVAHNGALDGSVLFGDAACASTRGASSEATR